MPATRIFARAMPEHISLTETYSYTQEISRNPVYRPDGKPQGLVKISVPYDGYRFFTHEAYADVSRHTTRQPVEGPPLLANIGHLAFDNTIRTNLDDVMDLSSHHNSIPIRVPITGENISQGGDLVSDRYRCEQQTEYTIKEPPIWPITVEIVVRDEEALEQMRETSGSVAARKTLEDTVSAITQQLSARETLCISFVVRATLSIGAHPTPLSPVIKRMSLKWPAPTSPEAFHMNLSAEPAQEVRCVYNPLKRCLEWGDIPLTQISAGAETDLLIYESTEMLLWVEQPGELYDQNQMSGEVSVEIPGWLLSGVDVRYFDSLGHLMNDSPTKVLTCLRISFELNLDDAFRHRVLSPRYHLYFDQVIPDDMSVLYLKTAIMDRGFRIVRDERILPEGSQSMNDAGNLRHFIEAKRPEGSATMWLWVVVTGKLHQSSRRTSVPGGQRYTSTVESGELIVHLAGQLAGKGHLLVQEMNALHRALRDRYDRLRALR